MRSSTATRGRAAPLVTVLLMALLMASRSAHSRGLATLAVLVAPFSTRRS